MSHTVSAAAAVDSAGADFTVAIVGTGPRGVAVFERLAVYLRAGTGRVRILLVDAIEMGVGRIWRTDQPPWLMMNTVVGELTMFSGVRDGGGCRPGAGCTFGEWLAADGSAHGGGLGDNDYAPRAVYGRYLKHVFAKTRVSLRGVAEVVEILGRVTAVRPCGDRYRLEIDGDGPVGSIDVDVVVLATGHGRNDLTGWEAELAAAARHHPDLRFVSGDSVADMNLDGISPGTPVGVIGLGLSFYDLALSLSLGRGGKFHAGSDGRLTYQRSGGEPTLIAGSRSGVPILTRGINQKSGTGKYRPRFLTTEALAELRDRAVRTNGRPALDLLADVLPLLMADVNLVYVTTLARRRLTPEAVAALTADLVATGGDEVAWRKTTIAHGLGDIVPLNLVSLGRPLAGRRFESAGAYRRALTDLLVEDVREARLGNVEGPLKAALDTFRDARETIRAAVEFGGLDAYSYREQFRRLAPLISLTTTGPPPVRTEQFLALLRAGVVTVVGPEAHFGYDPVRGRYTVDSPVVAGSRRYVSWLVDSRVPVTDLRRNRDGLIRQIVDEGVAAEFVIAGCDDVFATGGLHITPAENKVVSAAGVPHEGIYAIGIPTENVRWFTQIGNSRPGTRTSFQREADAVALSIARLLSARARTRPATGGLSRPTPRLSLQASSA
ncbi:FAD/NAD(P)-binding protein [Micromonospora sp. NPDC048999]|uniref:FAD/NAD(P)-binding protein n=1 Tax=Micromonospora sp. NPDC048999 TaxID=3155391 RepID=UPI0033EF89CF